MTLGFVRPGMDFAGRVRLYQSALLRTLGRDVYMINVRKKLRCGLCSNRRGNRLLCRIVEPWRWHIATQSGWTSKPTLAVNGQGSTTFFRVSSLADIPARVSGQPV